METGASSLNSMVCEHDDNNAKVKTSDELTLEALQSPSVQLFILNDTTLMSFVELPILDSVAGVKTASNQVRLILRDISGTDAHNIIDRSFYIVVYFTKKINLLRIMTNL